MIEIFILIYIVSVVMVIMLLNEVEKITIEDFKMVSFYKVLFVCVFPLINIVTIEYLLKKNRSNK